MNVYYAEVLPTLALRQKEVLTAIGSLGPCSNLELAKFMGREINTITPRVRELKDRDLIKELYRGPCKISGRTVIINDVNFDFLGEKNKDGKKKNV